MFKGLGPRDSKVIFTGCYPELLNVNTFDERMPVLAEHIAKALGLIELIEVVKDGELYHGYFRRK